MLMVELAISQHNFRTKNPLEYGCDFIDSDSYVTKRHKTEHPSKKVYTDRDLR